MNAKKKMIIAISAFAMVILAAVVAVVAVLAAQNVTVKSSLNVSYTVNDVVADVDVYAAVITNNTTINWGTAKTAVFGVDGYVNADSTGFSGQTSADGETSEANTSFDEMEITKKQCVVLKFVFTNKSASRKFTATLGAISTTGANVNISYLKGEATKPEDIAATSSEVLNVNAMGATGDVVTYCVKISIADTTKDVTEFKPSFDWTLAIA